VQDGVHASIRYACLHPGHVTSGLAVLMSAIQKPNSLSGWWMNGALNTPRVQFIRLVADVDRAEGRLSISSGMRGFLNTVFEAAKSIRDFAACLVKCIWRSNYTRYMTLAHRHGVDRYTLKGIYNRDSVLSATFFS
jgi:hypothetical protein